MDCPWDFIRWRFWGVWQNWIPYSDIFFGAWMGNNAPYGANERFKPPACSVACIAGLSRHPNREIAMVSFSLEKSDVFFKLGPETIYCFLYHMRKWPQECKGEWRNELNWRSSQRKPLRKRRPERFLVRNGTGDTHDNEKSFDNKLSQVGSQHLRLQLLRLGKRGDEGL